MRESEYPDYSELPYSQQIEIDDACDDFERALQAGQNPDPREIFLSASDGSRVPLLRELIELEHDQRKGDLRSIQTEYAHKFPEYQSAIEALTARRSHDLHPGSQLGSFRIERKIGAGGMGVVYEAYDTQLERNVALKLLPDEFARNRTRLQRFRREAKILAGLNHPNIATLFGFEEQQGCQYLVLEYVSGHTLGEILRRRKMPLRDTVDTFLQIAKALEHAHEAGIIHRDLKPANVKVLPHGEVKVLDFGLATIFPIFSCVDETQPPSTSPSSTTGSLNHPASTRPAADISQTTGISGTLPYMSPEQASRKPLDKRSDIWAFGCCLYEALTGRRAFPESTPEQLRKAIDEREPDWTLLPRELPQSLARLLRRCLTKNSRERLRDIGDARIELEDCLAGVSSATNLPANQEHGLPRAFVVQILSAALLGAVVAGIAVLGLMRWKADINVAAEVQTTVPLPLGVEVGECPGLALSPNGSHLAYVAVAQDGKSHLYVRRIADFHSTTRLDGTEGAEQPFYSPDGQTIGFFADHRLKTVSVSGGYPKLVCNAGHPTGGCWTVDDRIIFGWDFGGALDSILPDGSDRRNLARVGDAYYYCWPELLPDRRTLVFGSDRVLMADLDELAATPNQQTDAAHHPVLIRQGGFARYVNGHLLYGHRGTLHAVPFGLHPPRVIGATKTVAEDLWTERGCAQFAVSDRDVAYVVGEAMEEGQLVWKTRQPEEPPEPVWPGYQVYESFRISPDGKRLAIGLLGAEGYDVWIYDFATKTASNLDSEGENQRPIWSPDGKRIIFLSDRNERRGLYSKVVGTNQPPQLLIASPYRQTPVCFREDQKKLIFYRTNPDSSDDILEFDFDSLTTTTLVATDENEAFGVLSTDGKWLAYTATGATPDYQVFVGRYPPSTDPPTRISTQVGGLDPMWSPVDGNEIFYCGLQGTYTLFSAKLTREPFRVVKTEPILEGSYMDVPGFSYDYDPSTHRFLLIRLREDMTPKCDVRLLLNWSGRVGI